MSSRFSTVGENISFPVEEENILAYWDEIDAFQTSLKLSEGRPEFTFYDGPPFATGMPHYGHILAGTIKDTVTRYAHQTGHFVSRRAGWDTHGLPVEYEIDKKLGIKGREQVLEMGVKAYNAECRSIVMRYTAEWRKTINRLGRWIDFDNDYKTMDPTFMESVWWVFKEMHKKGLVYRGYKVMPYSTACGTPLSNFEAGLNYKEVKDPTVVATFPLVDEPDVAFIAWTTTPWTLPSNLALCVNPKMDYVKIRDKTRDGKVFILLEKRLSQIFPELKKDKITDERKAELYEVLERMKGATLVGKQYTPLFPYFKSLSTAFRVCGDDYVTEDGGTGVVHQAPAFGEDDYRVCVAHGIISKGENIPCPVDDNGRFTAEVPDFVGRHVKEADNDICATVKANGRLVVKENYAHSYPFCWRSDTPLIYRAVPSYFVAVESIKEKLLANNDKTYWVPQFVKDKRFHNWLADARDWAISRNRFWGTPIPLWVSDDLEEMVSVGSVEELYELSGVRITDLHKDSIDHITIPSKEGRGDLKRIEEVFDCWFESGSMPYAQLHYPFENKDKFEGGFPADFVAEGLDQTRGWFYTLMVISTCLFDKPAFKNLIVNGLVLASDGKKMSKRLKNYPDPELVINAQGADALRLYLVNSPVVRADVLRFKEEGVSDVVRGVLLPWFHGFRFFVQCADRYAKEAGAFTPSDEVARASTDELDVWVLAAVNGLIAYVHEEMRSYRLYTVVPRLVSFIDELTNWYVRLNRERLKGGSGSEQAFTGLSVLYYVLMNMSLIMCPLTPFFSEYLYQHLRKYSPLYAKRDDPSVAVDAVGRSDSVHFVMLPPSDPSRINKRVVENFSVLQRAVSCVRLARERRGIRANYPLKEVIVVGADATVVGALTYLKPQFMGEINARVGTISADWEKMCTLTTQANFATMGKRLGKQMKEVGKAIKELSHEQIADFMASGTITVAGHVLTEDDLVVKRSFNGDAKKYEAVASDDGKLVVAIDTSADEEILAELRAGTLAATVQKMRKAAGLVIEEEVEVYYEEVLKGKTAKPAGIPEALAANAAAVVKRIRALPLPDALRPAHAVVVAQETVKDTDVSSNAVVVTLTRPTVAVDEASPAVGVACKAAAVPAGMVSMYVQTMDPTAALAQDVLKLSLVGRAEGPASVALALRKGEHFFPNTHEMLRASAELRAKHGIPDSI